MDLLKEEEKFVVVKIALKWLEPTLKNVPCGSNSEWCIIYDCQFVT